MTNTSEEKILYSELIIIFSCNFQVNRCICSTVMLIFLPVNRITVYFLQQKKPQNWWIQNFYNSAVALELPRMKIPKNRIQSVIIFQKSKISFRTCDHARESTVCKIKCFERTDSFKWNPLKSPLSKSVTLKNALTLALKWNASKMRDTKVMHQENALCNFVQLKYNL